MSTIEERLTEVERKVEQIAVLEGRLTVVESLRSMTDLDLSSLQERVGANSRLLKAMAQTQSEHTQKLHEHTQILNEHGRKLDQHTVILNEHGRKLDQHTVMLNEHGRKLDDHGHKLDRILEILEKK